MRREGAKKLVLLLVGLATLVGYLPVAEAALATLNVSSSTSLKVGETKTFTVTVNSSTQAINSASGSVSLPDFLQPTSVSLNNSVFSLWTSQPSINGSSIGFSGGLASPGYQGSSGRLFSFTAKATKEGTGIIQIANTQILANDGLGTNVTGSSGYATVTATQVVSGATISSPTHPDPGSWYNNKNVTLKWSRPNNASTYSYAFSNQAGKSLTGDSSVQEANFSDIDEGVWTLSLTTKFKDGKTANSSFVVQIDVTAPLEFAVTVNQSGPSDQKPKIAFEAKDQLSGISKYIIRVDGLEDIETTDPNYQLPLLRPGRRTITVTAYDKAGNSKEAKTDLVIEGFGGPVITNYPRIVTALQPITFTGRALYGTTLNLYLDGKLLVSFPIKDNLSPTQLAEKQKQNADYEADREVEWRYTYQGPIFPGKKTVFATQTKGDGSESEQSNMVTVRILAGWVTIGGTTLPTGPIFIVLIAILVGVILRFIIFWRRRREIKEDEYEQHRRAMEQAIDADLSILEKTIDDHIHDQLGADALKAIHRNIVATEVQLKSAVKKVEQPKRRSPKVDSLP